ncbi:uncharacterized protein LOC134848457 isoform X2 [Symsagittifera roscoffensis]
MYTVHPGSCPASVFTVDPHVTPNCVNECTVDSTCPVSHKCCGHVHSASKSVCFSCMEALNRQFEYPPLVSSSLRVNENVETSSFDLSWDSWSAVGKTGKIIFIVRQRNTTGFYPKEGVLPRKKWSIIGVTDQRFMNVPTKPGWWSEFQVASVNRFGSKGFEKSSVVKRLSGDPKPPEAPDRVYAHVTQIESNKLRVNNVTVVEGEQSDLPVIAYQVSFMCRPSTIALESKRTIDSSSCQYGICRLSISDDVFFACSQIRFYVTVTSVCDDWGPMKLNSSRISRELIVSQSSDNLRVFDQGSMMQTTDAEGSMKIEIEDRIFFTDHVILGIIWIPPVSKRSLNYTMEWVRGFCFDPARNFIEDHDRGRKDLRNAHREDLRVSYECEYAFQVRGKEKSIQKDVYTKMFITPSCEEHAKVSNIENLTICGKALKSPLSPFNPGQLANLSFFFTNKNVDEKTRTLTINAVARWEFDDDHFNIVTNELTKKRFSPVIEILVYKIHEKIGIINLAVQPCGIYLNGERDPKTGVMLLPKLVNLLDSKLPRPCVLHYPNKYRLAARIVYTEEFSAQPSETRGRWSSVLLDTSIISYFDIFPPWKQDFYRKMGINNYLEAIEYEQKRARNSPDGSNAGPSYRVHTDEYYDYYEAATENDAVISRVSMEINYIIVNSGSELKLNVLVLVIVALFVSG